MNSQELKQFIDKNHDNFSIQLKRHHKDIYDKINSLFCYSKFNQKIYHYLNTSSDLGKCELCGKQTQYDGYWKGYRKHCSYKCLNRVKLLKAREKRNCVICGNEFEIYKKREKTTCSNDCLLKLNSTKEVNDKRQHSLKKTMMKMYDVEHPSQMPNFSYKLKQTKFKNHGNENYVNVSKAKRTKLEKYGNENYINVEKIRETCMRKYGVSNIFQLPSNKTNGKKVSKFQKREYEKILKDYPDAKLEKYLTDVQKSVDIFIPSKKKIVECFGDYWHCNPSIYSPDYYHKYVHMNAKEIWKRDEERIQSFKNAGYDVEIVWENTNKHFKHSTQ